MIDFHSHVLPGMDDGSDSVETSLKMLRSEWKQGVTLTVSTSHYYPRQESIASYLERRQEAYRTLSEAIADEQELPKLRLGAEVYLSSELPKDEMLDRLCIEGTNCILLEMPRDLWQPWLIDSVYYIVAVRKLVPVIAHVDRYDAMLKNVKKLKEMFSMDLYVQLNAEAFLHWQSRGALKKILALEKPIVLGSDMHNMRHRAPQLGKACRKIRARFGDGFLQEMQENAEFLLKL